VYYTNLEARRCSANR